MRTYTYEHPPTHTHAHTHIHARTHTHTQTAEKTAWVADLREYIREVQRNDASILKL